MMSKWGGGASNPARLDCFKSLNEEKIESFNEKMKQRKAPASLYFRKV